MWRTLLGLCLLVGITPIPSEAQQWTGTATLNVSGGHQTNAYLDPVLGSWDSTIDPMFMAITPQIGLTRDASRTRLDVTARTRMYPDRDQLPQYTQGNVRLRYRLSPAWSVEATGGGTRYRLASTRDSWWALPSVRWTPTSTTSITLRGGLTERYERSYVPTDQQTSGIAALDATTWLTDHLQGRLHFFLSEGRSAVADTDFGGTGAAARGTYWPTNSWSIETEVAVEQLRYEDYSSTGQLETVRERIGRIGLETQWQAHPSVSLFGRARAAHLEQADRPDTDVHVSGGIRFRVQRVLGGSAELPPLRRVCENTDEGVRIRIPYDGLGTPHLTGDFNSWSSPGIPMERTENDRWSVLLDLPPGRYEYRVRIVKNTQNSDNSSTWLDLPSYAQTADDAFGGSNGVCTAH